MGCFLYSTPLGSDGRWVFSALPEGLGIAGATIHQLIDGVTATAHHSCDPLACTGTGEWSRTRCPAAGALLGPALPFRRRNAPIPPVWAQLRTTVRSWSIGGDGEAEESAVSSDARSPGP